MASRRARCEAGAANVHRRFRYTKKRGRDASFFCIRRRCESREQRRKTRTAGNESSGKMRMKTESSHLPQKNPVGSSEGNGLHQSRLRRAAFLREKGLRPNKECKDMERTPGSLPEGVGRERWIVCKASGRPACAFRRRMRKNPGFAALFPAFFAGAAKFLMPIRNFTDAQLVARPAEQPYAGRV